MVIMAQSVDLRAINIWSWFGLDPLDKGISRNSRMLFTSRDH